MSGAPDDVPGGEDAPLDPRLVRLFALLFYGLLGGTGLFWVRLRTGEWWPEPFRGGDVTRSLLYGGAFAVVVLAATGPLMRWVAWLKWLAHEMRRMLGPLDLSTVLVLSLASGVAEEVFFRGALLPVVGLIASSLLFGLIHTGPDRRYVAWTAFTLVVGFALGWIVVATGSLAGAVFAHVTINAVNLWRIGRLEVPEGFDDPRIPC